MKLIYRQEIDGLRAIAVVAIILYHAKITIFGHQLFKGGFVGVDIFFVISGYLISSIILKELVSTGSFSFKYFYQRRIRRIIPVLLFVMFVSLLFAWMFLLPASLVDFSKSILYSLVFISNFYFHYSGQVYAAESGLLKPFLHTWSLSVEEQFYILFPIFIYITFKYFRKYLIYILFFGFVISLAFSDWGSKNHPSFTFYVLPTRAWELVAGSILAYLEIKNRQRSKYKIFNLILPFIGSTLIGYSIFFYSDEMFHPSLSTLSPVMGTCLIIWFSSKNEIITKILSTKLFVGIGLISYSLYLWHYPIFAFARITEFAQESLSKLLLAIILLLISIFSYFFIEQVFRNKKYNFKCIFIILGCGFVMLFFGNLNIILKNGYKERVPEILNNNSSEQTWLLLTDSDNKTCFDRVDSCVFNRSGNKKVFIIGDSHMGSLTFDLKKKLLSKNYQFIVSTVNSCIFFPLFDRIDIKTKKIFETCNNNYFQKIKKKLSAEKNSIFIFGGRWELYLSNYYFDNSEGAKDGDKSGAKYVSLGKYKTIQESFKSNLEKISKNNQIILIYPIPEVGFDPNKAIMKQWIKSGFLKEFNLKYFTTSYQVFMERNKSTFDLLDSITGDNIYRVYPSELFCKKLIKFKDRCLTHNEKNIFYSDTNHPSKKGAEMINDLIIEEIGKINNRNSSQSQNNQIGEFCSFSGRRNSGNISLCYYQCSKTGPLQIQVPYGGQCRANFYR